MIEANSPIDIGKKEITKYKEGVESKLAAFNFTGSRSLPDLLRGLDPSEKYMVGELERATYVTIREGMQIFQVVNDRLKDKVGYTEVLKSGSNEELPRLRGFCNGYATFVASTYVANRLESILSDDPRFEGFTGDGDLAVLRLDSTQPSEMVENRLLRPVYSLLMKHHDTDAKYTAPVVFVAHVKEIFERYATLAKEDKEAYSDLNHHLKGTQLRLMDGFLEIVGYEPKTTTRAKVIATPSFQPITPQEIVGNRGAKRKIVRYMQRLALYDSREGRNPILEFGGLSWTNLFDGPPGTGKSSGFRLAMTVLHEACQTLGLPYHLVTVDQSIKDEYYGKTGKILLERLSVTNIPTDLSLVIFDDIDLLTSHRDDAQGADNDINNIIMQYLDGVYTVRRGSVINFAASNKPTGLDDALRNRFNDRILIDGPTTAEDFSDMVNIMAKDLLTNQLLVMGQGYTPFETQDVLSHTGSWTAQDVASYAAEKTKNYVHATIHEWGCFMHELKGKNPKITGRSVRAILEAVRERTANFDVPPEWLIDRSTFHDLPYARKVAMLKELYSPISPQVLFEEALRYFDSEERFAATERDGHVSRLYNNLIWEAEAKLNYYREQCRLGDTSVTAKVVALERFLHKKILEREETIRKAEETTLHGGVA